MVAVLTEKWLETRPGVWPRSHGWIWETVTWIFSSGSSCLELTLTTSPAVDWALTTKLGTIYSLWIKGREQGHNLKPGKCQTSQISSPSWQRLTDIGLGLKSTAHFVWKKSSMATCLSQAMLRFQSFLWLYDKLHAGFQNVECRTKL